MPAPQRRALYTVAAVLCAMVFNLTTTLMAGAAAYGLAFVVARVALVLPVHAAAPRPHLLSTATGE